MDSEPLKQWAYYHEDDSWLRIGVKTALAREKSEPGKWKSRTYYSTHADPNQRLRMHIRKSPRGLPLFAYNPGQRAEIERDGGGESLTHLLYKTALSEIKSTTLKISNLGKDIEISIIDSTTEKRVWLQGRYYDIDVFYHFSSNSDFELRWGGMLGLEVHHTNPVNDTKKTDLNTLRIPVIEVDVPAKLAYLTTADNTSPEREREYIEFVKPRLSEYLWGKMISNPKSIDYLERENAQLSAELKRIKIEADEMREENNNLHTKIRQYRRKLNSERQAVVESTSEHNLAKQRYQWFEQMSVLRFLWFKLTRR